MRLLLAPDGRSGSTCLWQLGFVDARAGDVSGSHGGFIAIGGALVQGFRLRIVMTIEPSVPLSAPRVRPRTQKRRMPQCRLCRIYGHEVPTRKLRGGAGRQETARADDGGRTHSAIPRQGSRASHRTADAPSDPSNRPTQSSRRATELMRQRRSTVARRIADIPALGRLFEDSERGGLRNVGAAKVGAGTAPDETICNVFCLTHERPAGEKSCAAFLRRYWMWRAPPTKEGADRYIRSRADWKERVAFRLAWMPASCLSEIAVLTPRISR
ncbi:phosphatidylinositol-4-phosphate 5-kinase-like, putative [Trypanosoma cruzi]|nr:phosphatidylinositol-4-phosphate 5-kinase-like, putative [Trypanosoma cruzi]